MYSYTLSHLCFFTKLHDRFTVCHIMALAGYLWYKVLLMAVVMVVVAGAVAGGQGEWRQQPTPTTTTLLGKREKILWRQTAAGGRLVGETGERGAATGGITPVQRPGEMMISPHLLLHPVLLLMLLHGG